MFISNNRASFHLWCKENLVKHQKVAKYNENDCRSSVWSRKLFVCTTSVSLHAYSSPVFLIAGRNCKNIHICSVRCNSVSSSSSNVEILVKLRNLLLVHLVVL